jgi:hypothetical protein
MPNATLFVRVTANTGSDLWDVEAQCGCDPCDGDPGGGRRDLDARHIPEGENRRREFVQPTTVYRTTCFFRVNPSGRRYQTPFYESRNGFEAIDYGHTGATKDGVPVLELLNPPEDVSVKARDDDQT